MQDDIVIRQAKAGDVVAIRDIAVAAYAPYVADMPIPPRPLEIDYARQIDAGDTWAALTAGRLAGFVVFDTRAGFWIDNIAVDPALQARGIGSRLLDYAERQASARGFDRLRLYTPAIARKNRAWYAGHGYIEFDRRVDEGRDRVFLEKRLV
ncbi:GNAT family N-acetyltransferase [Salinisphaera sp. SPP-AMP-43]|uniref:GNAT family N-acetyltransferase n=1 Tax=Salinisphaera sp. SPP-AMP-43 TaxID=3121288 RepID=UPI003C6E12BB